ncbi:MAG: hypothetical protein [Circular genetic element sp.]|nr:MAG: hypothetical protein [Circular genetic element sp.]
MLAYCLWAVLLVKQQRQHGAFIVLANSKVDIRNRCKMVYHHSNHNGDSLVCHHNSNHILCIIRKYPFSTSPLHNCNCRSGISLARHPCVVDILL